jgi:hypothetical protein
MYDAADESTAGEYDTAVESDRRRAWPHVTRRTARGGEGGEGGRSGEHNLAISLR